MSIHFCRFLIILIFTISNAIAFKLLKNGFHSHSKLSLQTKMVATQQREEVKAISKTDPMKLGVLLLNLGGPETQKDVEGFLYNLFADPDIIRLPSFLSILQKPLAFFIAKRRAPKSSAAYRSIGGGSPIVKYTQAQSDLIQAELLNRGLNTKCYFAMRYWNPFTEEALENIQKDGINTLVIIPLYPQFSISTSGSSLRLLQEIFYGDPENWGPQKIRHTVVPAWYHRSGYVTAMSKLILKEILSFSSEERTEGIDILFSAHGVPQSYIEAGDPYQRHIEEGVRLIARELSMLLETTGTTIAGRPHFTGVGGMSTLSLSNTPNDSSSSSSSSRSSTLPVRLHLSFQSRVGPVQWLRPYTEDRIVELGNSGVKNLVVVPVSFVSEHIETLEEIDMEYRELAEEHGVKTWKRVPALNMDEDFIKDMADMVVEALSLPVVSVMEAATQTISDIDHPTFDPPIGLTKADRVNGNWAIINQFGSALAETFSGDPIIQGLGFGR